MEDAEEEDVMNELRCASHEGSLMGSGCNVW